MTPGTTVASDVPYLEEAVLATSRYLGALHDLSDEEARAPSLSRDAACSADRLERAARMGSWAGEPGAGWHALLAGRPSSDGGADRRSRHDRDEDDSELTSA